MENTKSVSLSLSIVLLFVYRGQSQCIPSEMCCYHNTRGISANSSLTMRRTMYPASCRWACTMSPECDGTTYNPTTETCELHAEVDGEPFISLIADIGLSFCMSKNHEGSCPKVSGQVYYLNVCLNELTLSGIRVLKQIWWLKQQFVPPPNHA